MRVISWIASPDSPAIPSSSLVQKVVQLLLQVMWSASSRFPPNDNEKEASGGTSLQQQRQQSA